MNNKVLKTVIKALAEAPQHAATVALKRLQTDEERAEARRIFKALKIDIKDD